MNSRRRTLKSRSNIPQKARHCRPELFTQVPPGELNEHGLQRGLVHGDVSQVISSNLDDPRQNSVAACSENTKTFGKALDGRHVPQLAQLFCQRGAVNLSQVQLKHLLCSYATLQFLWCVANKNLSVIDDGNSITQFVSFFHVVRCKQDGDALLPQGTNVVPKRQARLRIEAGAGLIEKQDSGIVSDRARDLHPLCEASREFSHERFAALAELKHLQQFARALGGLRVAEPEVSAMEVDVFPNCALPVERVVLWHDAHVASGLSRMRDHVDARDSNFARSGKRARGADADRRRFAGSVRSEKTEELSRVHEQIDALDGFNRHLAGVGLEQLFDSDDGEICGVHGGD